MTWRSSASATRWTCAGAGPTTRAELRATVSLATALILHYEIDESLGLLRPAAERWAPPGAPLDTDRVALLAQLSRALFFHEDNELSIAVADRALPAAERLDELALVADLLITRGTALGSIGRYHEGQGAKRAGIRLADEQGLISTSLRGRINLSANEQSDPAAAFSIAREALDTATKFGRHGHAVTLLMNASSTAIEVGEWDWAFERWIAEVERAPDEHGRILARWNMASLRTYRGEDVGDEVAALVEWARQSGDFSVLASIDALTAELASSEGRLAEACDLMRAAARADSLNGPDILRQVGVLALIANDPERAREALEAFVAMGYHRRLWDLDMGLIRAGITAQTSANGTERGIFLETIDAYREMGLPYRQVLGTVALMATFGPDDPAFAAPIAEAEAIIHRLGAVPMQRHLERLRARPAMPGVPDGRSATTARPAARPAAVRD